ncbi:MAG: hypothetical protein ABIJ12_00210, partial [bacterium]
HDHNQRIIPGRIQLKRSIYMKELENINKKPDISILLKTGHFYFGLTERLCRLDGGDGFRYHSQLN